MAAERALLAPSARSRLAVWVLGLCLLCHVSGDSAFLLSEPQDFDETSYFLTPQVFDSELCWLVLFTSLHALDEEEEAKRRFLLLPHYNKTFVTFATSTVEEQPDIAAELGVNVSNIPRVCE
eukprot:scaffold4012_cov63-Phaeocystis_antarctica.AAC.3